MCLQKNGRQYDLCEQLSSDMHGAVTQLCTALSWDISVPVRPLKSNTPLVFIPHSYFTLAP